MHTEVITVLGALFGAKPKTKFIHFDELDIQVGLGSYYNSVNESYIMFEFHYELEQYPIQWGRYCLTYLSTYGFIDTYNITFKTKDISFYGYESCYYEPTSEMFFMKQNWTVFTLFVKI